MSSALQAFKETDLVEPKVRDAILPFSNLRDSELDEFFLGAYECFILGDVLYLTGHPLSGVIQQDVFRMSFPAIHELFTRPGTFEFYLDVFRSVWGEDVEIEFMVPAPGVLQINIDALVVIEYTALFREIVDNVYVFSEWVDDEGDNIIFQGTQGIKTQEEAEALVNEFRPAGIWTETTLSIS